ncbi:MAG: hypothetical protein ABIP77_04380 [Candidatus Limnocylindrales bacterium]
MQNLKRHLRGLMVAIAALSISASAVFAASAHTQGGSADAAAAGLDNAAKAASKVSLSSRPAKSVDDADDADEETTEVGSESVSHPLNHGWYVSQAAKMVTPAGFDNHGAYVSSIARGVAGKPTTATTATKATDPGAEGHAKAAAAKADAVVRKAEAAARKAARQP